MCAFNLHMQRRRWKIKEKLKTLQQLVPGCDNVRTILGLLQVNGTIYDPLTLSHQQSTSVIYVDRTTLTDDDSNNKGICHLVTFIRVFTVYTLAHHKLYSTLVINS